MGFRGNFVEWFGIEQEGSDYILEMIRSLLWLWIVEM